jgi:glycine dehydrogenase
MLERVGFSSLDDLIDSAVPASIRLHKSLSMDEPMSESEALAKLKSIMAKNKVKCR